MVCAGHSPVRHGLARLHVLHHAVAGPSQRLQVAVRNVPNGPPDNTNLISDEGSSRKSQQAAFAKPCPPKALPMSRYRHAVLDECADWTSQCVC
eukprot:scaffold89647_cov34-Prasinocladus_malaysianus.AAC.2